MVTLQASTRGKSFYLGKISPGKFTSGFIFPRLKGHTGDHGTLGGYRLKGLNFSSRVQNFGAKMENMAENQTDQRKGFIIISLLFITLLQRARRARVILLQRLISRRIQRQRRAAFRQFLTIFACRKQQRSKRVAWVLPRPQYWFVPFQHVKHVVERKFSSFKGNI